MEIIQLVNESFKTAEEKGWHDEDRTFGDLMALIHSEVSEALEEYRNDAEPDEVYYDADAGRKPLGVPIELADILIRVGDVCGIYGIDLEEAVRIKLEYNKSRPHRHGGKKL